MQEERLDTELKSSNNVLGVGFKFRVSRIVRVSINALFCRPDGADWITSWK